MISENNTITHRNRIITDLYTSKEFNDCINKMEPDYLREDLRNEVMLILCGKDPQMIIGLHERNELRWYVVRIILNMVRSNSSPFVKTYRKLMTDKIPEQPVVELNGRVVKELKEQMILRYINTELYWYDREIVQMYMRLGSYRAIEKETGIPWESAYGTVRRVQDKIKNEVLNVTE